MLLYVYECVPAGHVQEVRARLVVSLTEAAVAVTVVVGHAVVPAVAMRGVPADHGQSHIRQNVSHVRRNRPSSSLVKTTAAGVPARSVIRMLLADELLSHGRVK